MTVSWRLMYESISMSNSHNSILNLRAGSNV